MVSGEIATWALAHPFVVTRAWAGVLAALLLLLLLLATHSLVRSSAPAQAASPSPPSPPAAPAAPADPVAAAAAVASAAQVRARRRGVKSLIIGTDGRASTSKTQVVLWTFAVFYAFVFLLIWGRSIGCPGDPQEGSVCAVAEGARAVFTDAANGPLKHEYYALLGLPVIAAVAAKSVTETSRRKGTLDQDQLEAGQEGVAQGLSEIVGTDTGDTDLIDFQYFAFTLLALAYFLTEFLTSPSAGLPDLPPTLVALSGVSTGAYTAKKALSRSQPSVVRDSGS